jgi:hypothetical protein
LQSLEEARRGELNQVAVARVTARKQRQVVVLDSMARGRHGLVVVDEIHLAADDRLDPRLARSLVELDRAVHHAVVGQRERRLAESGRTLDQACDLRRTVEQRVLGVNVKMCAGGLGHPVG